MTKKYHTLFSVYQALFTLMRTYTHIKLIESCRNQNIVFSLPCFIDLSHTDEPDSDDVSESCPPKRMNVKNEADQSPSSCSLELPLPASDRTPHISYPVQALVDIPMNAPLTRSSRTSSLSSSLSSFRFGGSLSQLWASQMSLTARMPNMKSTG